MYNEGKTDLDYVAEFKAKVLKKAISFATLDLDVADTREIKDWVDIVQKLTALETTQSENKVHILLEKIGAKFQDDL